MAQAWDAQRVVRRAQEQATACCRYLLLNEEGPRGIAPCRRALAREVLCGQRIMTRRWRAPGIESPCSGFLQVTTPQMYQVDGQEGVGEDCSTWPEGKQFEAECHPRSRQQQAPQTRPCQTDLSSAHQGKRQLEWRGRACLLAGWAKEEVE